MTDDMDLGPPTQVGPLLEALDRHGVDFVVIGGIAGLIHGSAYPTFDLDVAYARDESNLARMAAVLEELGVSLRGAPPELPFQPDARSLANGANFTFASNYGALDILGDVAGIRDYEDLRSASQVSSIEGVPVRVASLNHLIAMKRAANRTKDQLMVEEYLVIADEQRRTEDER
jgi:predicted nucleotidyltransferase